MSSPTPEQRTIATRIYSALDIRPDEACEFTQAETIKEGIATLLSSLNITEVSDDKMRNLTIHINTSYDNATTKDKKTITNELNQVLPRLPPMKNILMNKFNERAGEHNLQKPEAAYAIFTGLVRGLKEVTNDTGTLKIMGKLAIHKDSMKSLFKGLLHTFVTKYPEAVQENGHARTTASGWVR